MSEPAAQAPVIRLHPDDNILIALRPLAAGTQIGDIEARRDIPRAHKLAAAPIATGAPVIRYGQVIGQATAEIAPGDHVHSHNLGMAPHGTAPASSQAPLPAPGAPAFFDGYLRADGRVGTRNYLGVLTSVNCSGSVARFIAQRAEQSGLLDEFPGIDGIVPIVHGTGCGMAASGEGYETLMRVIRGYAAHPNFGGVLLVGLGCEVMQLAALTTERMRADANLKTLIIQDSGGTAATVAQGVAALREMAPAVDALRRTRQPASMLVLGMQCGGSDGYSGITANPALGIASDLLVAQGGISILSETPEIYGAEHLLTSRATSPEIAAKLMERIAWWEDYTARNGGEMDNNPSPGNKRGGLTTILEKSLGAVAKGGSAPLSGVYLYGEKITAPGFVFMDSPGYDPASVTGQIASGANLIVFTTGRGSVSGYKPVPGLKLATNSEMYARLEGDMDLDCGDVIAQGLPLEAKGREIFELMLNAASGARTKSERLGFGDAEFVPWQIGAVM
ncbi:MAG: altronate dehydratase family protein [Paracoccus sp. (in: a-proteobacteria)]|nr:altronate dehydratase family protein [Paracoccus sp. (in: a-proteobacteria)]